MTAASDYLVLAAVFAASAGLTGLLTRELESRRILDVPNPRSSHARPVPRGGGLAAVIVFLAAITLLGQRAGFDERLYWALLVGGAWIAAVGLADDVLELRPLARFVLTLAAVVACCLWLGTPPLAFGSFVIAPGSGALYLLEGVLLIWVLNLFNFMDGTDAIAGVEAITIALGAGVILTLVSPGHYAVASLMMLAAATAGFLVWNWPPAKVFMGDTASGFLGFCLGLFAIRTSMDDDVNVWVWMILFGVFFCDATVTLLRRVWRRKKFYKAHRDHAYQRFARALQRRYGGADGARRGRAHAVVALGVGAVNVFWLAPLALLAALRPEWGAACAALALLPLAGVALYAGAGGGE